MNNVSGIQSDLIVVVMVMTLFSLISLFYIARNNKREEKRTELKHQLIMQRFNVDSTEYLLEKENNTIEGYTLLVHGKKYRVKFTTRNQNDDVQLIKVVHVPL